MLTNGICINQNISEKMHLIICGGRPILTWREDLVSINKNLSSSGFYRSSRLQSEGEGRWKAEQIPRPCWRTEKFAEQIVHRDTNCSRSPWNSPQEPGQETGWTEDQRKDRVHPDHSTVKISFLKDGMSFWEAMEVMLMVRYFYKIKFFFINGIYSKIGYYIRSNLTPSINVAFSSNVEFWQDKVYKRYVVRLELNISWWRYTSRGQVMLCE